MLRNRGRKLIRGLSRRERERTAGVQSIRGALIEGEKSGEPKRFDPQAFKRRMQVARG